MSALLSVRTLSRFLGGTFRFRNNFGRSRNDIVRVIGKIRDVEVREDSGRKILTICLMWGIQKYADSAASEMSGSQYKVEIDVGEMRMEGKNDEMSGTNGKLCFTLSQKEPYQNEVRFNF